MVMKSPSPKMVLIKADLAVIYQNLLKIRCVAQSIFLPEINQLIAFGMLHSKGKFDVEAIEKVKALLYAYSQSEIQQLVCNFSSPPELEESCGAQYIANCEEFNIALAAAISYHEYSEYEDVESLSPHLTFISDRMLTLSGQETGFFSRLPELRSIDTEYVVRLARVLNPEKIVKLALYNPRRAIASCEVGILKLFENVEQLTCPDGYLDLIPHPEKIKVLATHPTRQAGLPVKWQCLEKYASLETLTLLDGHGYNLWELPEPARLKKIHILNYRYTPEILAKLENLEDLTLHLDCQVEEDVALLRGGFLTQMPKLHTLRMIVKRGEEKKFLSLLAEGISYPHIKTFDYCQDRQHERNEIQLITTLFPHLEVFKHDGYLCSKDSLLARGIAIGNSDVSGFYYL
jgi:hypothetical protein